MEYSLLGKQSITVITDTYIYVLYIEYIYTYIYMYVHSHYIYRQACHRKRRKVTKEVLTGYEQAATQSRLVREGRAVPEVFQKI